MTQTAERFTTAASEQLLQSVAAALRERNLTPLVVDTPADARRAVLEMIPDGAEVHDARILGPAARREQRSGHRPWCWRVRLQHRKLRQVADSS